MQPEGSARLEVAVPPDAVWAAVADVTRHPEWSAECVGAEWTGGADGPAVGATFIGHNRVGDYAWDAPCRVTEVEPGRRFAYQVGEDPPAAVWSWELEPTADGHTSVTHSFNAPDLLRPDYPFPGRDQMLRDGIETTLVRLREVLEARTR